MKIDNNPFYDLSSELQNVHVCLKQSYEFANVHNYQEAAIAVHGYTTKFIKENGLAPKTAYDRLGKYISGDPIASHYLAFDGLS